MKNAIQYLKLQEEQNDIAENRFYLALTYKKLDQIETYQANLATAHKLYIHEKKMNDPYNSPFDKVYLQQIEEEMNKLSNQ